MDLSPRIIASRRLTGPNLFAQSEGAVLEIADSTSALTQLLQRWRANAELLMHRLQWDDEQIVVRPHAGGANCFLTAPIDALLAATEVAEQAWLGAEDPAHFDVDDIAARLWVAVLHERAPRLAALQVEARARGLEFLTDDDEVSIGRGTGSITWPRNALPSPNDVAWDALHEIPVALVTGSNGKTTTTRLLAAMLARGGGVVAHSSTDGVHVGREVIARGDYSGPGGARVVLRDRRVTAAVLETARGGILRRGLAVRRADVAVVTRVTADHFGEYGITDLEALAQVKLLVARIVPSTGRIVLNADDPLLVSLASSLVAPITWFSMCGPPSLGAASDRCTFLDGDDIVLMRGTDRTSLGSALQIPIALGGAARHNIANALAAAACADAMGVSADSIREVLSSFGIDPHDNPGRLVMLERAGVRIVVDYVHNPDGWEAIHAALRELPAKRRLMVVGQAGDRGDDALEALAHAVLAGKPDLVFLKELPSMFRGRAAGETAAVLAKAFHALGVSDDSIVHTPDERAAVAAALAQARAGDLVILSVHEDYAGTMEFLAREGVVAMSR